MRLKFLLFLLILSVFFFFSCQKEVDWNINPRVVNGGDSVLISKLIELDTTLPAPFDSVYYDCFVYDQRNRITTIYSLERTGPVYDTLYRVQLFYIGNDTLPYKGSFYDRNILAEDKFNYYDISGRIIRDSIADYDPPFTADIKRYTYLSGKLLINHSLRIPSLGIFDSSSYYFYQTRSGNNIVTQRDTVDFTTSGGGLYVTVLNYQYDNHANPLKKNWYYFPFYQFDEGILENFSDNNFLEVRSEKYDSFTQTTDIYHSRFSYQYGSNNLPSVCRRTNLIDGSVIKYIYLYTK